MFLLFQISRYSHESMERPSVEMDEIVRIRYVRKRSKKSYNARRSAYAVYTAAVDIVATKFVGGVVEIGGRGRNGRPW